MTPQEREIQAEHDRAAGNRGDRANAATAFLDDLGEPDDAEAFEAPRQAASALLGPLRATRRGVGIQSLRPFSFSPWGHVWPSSVARLDPL